MSPPALQELRCPTCGSHDVQPDGPTRYLCRSCGGKSTLSADRQVLIVLGGWSCPKCGTNNPHGAKFCAFCGSPLARSCLHCGTILYIGDKFCSNCGTAFDVGPLVFWVCPRCTSLISDLAHVAASKLGTFNAKCTRCGQQAPVVLGRVLSVQKKFVRGTPRVEYEIRLDVPGSGQRSAMYELSRDISIQEGHWLTMATEGRRTTIADLNAGGYTICKH